MLSDNFQKYFGNKGKEFFFWPEAGNLEIIKNELNPSDYLDFAKNDLKENSPRNIINSISNSKRAIDCTVDQVFYSLGLENNSDRNRENQKKLLSYTGITNKRNGVNFKILVLNALGIIPIKYISKMRVLRNAVEHEYTLPEYNEAEDSFEEATLIVNTIENVTRKYPDEYYLFAEKDKNYASFSYTDNSHVITFIDKESNDETNIEILKNDISGLLITKLSIAIGKEHDIQEEFDLFSNHLCKAFYGKELTASVDTYWPPPSRYEEYINKKK